MALLSSRFGLLDRSQDIRMPIPVGYLSLSRMQTARRRRRFDRSSWWVTGAMIGIFCAVAAAWLKMD